MEKIKINCCVKCGHKWTQRKKGIPKQCPSCRNRNWNKVSQKDLVKFIVG